MQALSAIVLAALAFLSTTSPGVERAELTIQVWNFGFAPHPIRLDAGRPVTLRFVNGSGSGHDFTAPGFFQHARITAGAAPGGEIELHAHETKVITLVPSAGAYEAHCSHFLHKQMGMSDVIIVS
jgi:plastocyanin